MLKTAQSISWSRREFLRAAAGTAAGIPLFGLASVRTLAAPRERKAVVVTFGGGTRDDETFAPEGQENIPHLLTELVPRATFFTQVVNRGILGHYVANASIVTGVYETVNNFASLPPDHPTVFEYFRKDLKRSATDAWVIAPSNGFSRIGESAHGSYGSGQGAGVILPKRLLAASLAGNTTDFEHLLRDNYETPILTPELVPSVRGNDMGQQLTESHMRQLNQTLKLSVDDFVAHARSVSSPDELSVYIARRLMEGLAPSLLWITLHDIDIAHTGTYSLYIDGIRRCDRLCSEIWKAIESKPEYSGKTTLFILPDFGRDSDNDPGGNGFQHHRTGDPLSRTTWMLVMGPDVRENVTVDRPVESIDLVPTLALILGFSPRFAQGRPLTEVT